MTVLVPEMTDVAELRVEKEAHADVEGEPVGELVRELSLENELVAETVDVFARVLKLVAEFFAEAADEDDTDSDAILADADVDGEADPSIDLVIVTTWVTVSVEDMKDVEVEDTRGVMLANKVAVIETLLESKFVADTQEAVGEPVITGDCDIRPDEEGGEVRDAVEV